MAEQESPPRGYRRSPSSELSAFRSPTPSESGRGVRPRDLAGGERRPTAREMNRNSPDRVGHDRRLS